MKEPDEAVRSDIFFDAIQEMADATSPDGYSSEHTPVFDYLLEGFALAQKAGGNPVWFIDSEEFDTFLFFIGDENTIEQRMKAEAAKVIQSHAPPPKDLNAPPTEIPCPTCGKPNWSNENKCWSCGDPLHEK
jgi:hypothetical protein